MRILMVSDVYFPRVNGVSTSIQTLRQVLAEAGHSNVLVTPDYPAAAAEAGIVRVPGWPIPRDPEDRLMHPRALAAALDTLDPADFDLVHIHTPFLAHRAGVRWARKHGLPCVETYHTLFEEYFHHYLPFLPKKLLAAAARMISRKECDGVTAVIAWNSNRTSGPGAVARASCARASGPSSRRPDRVAVGIAPANWWSGACDVAARGRYVGGDVSNRLA